MNLKLPTARALFASVVLTVAVVSPVSVATPVAAAGLVVSDMNHGVTASDMANALVGSGVTVSNVTYTGDARAAGKFSGGAPSVGFDNGIILDSGKVQTYPGDPPCSRGVEGPNTCFEQWSVPPPGGGPGPAGISNSTAFNQPGDADLTALSGFQTFDASVLQFDFVPQFPTVQFQYVFSSEEYSDFSNTQFNDVFGFFINGTNCAMVPSTNMPVSVNTINNGNDVGGDPTPHNPQFFRDNVRPTPTLDTQMDGLTTVLTCTATAKANQTNHMKLAIADASDMIFDSAVFLKGGSLISGTAVTTSLKGGGQSGPIITVPQGTAVTDSATLTGANAPSATGTVTYTVFADANCSMVFASAGTKTVVNGTVPDSDPVTMTATGTFYWQASYSGDALNNASMSPCGSEVVTVTSTEQKITAQGVDVNATEGQSFTGAVATFNDPDTNATAAEYTATINWGDGSPTEAGVVSGGAPMFPGKFTVTGTHTYSEENSYKITVVITDTDNMSNTATVTPTATVGDAQLANATCEVPPVIVQTYSGPTGSFTDNNSSATSADFTATIDWGDGTSSGMVSGAGPGPYTVNGSHTYSSTGSFTVTTSVQDDGGSTITITCKTLVAAFPTANGGTFVVGDTEAEAPPMIGNHLTWWSSQWAQINQMSGGPAPSSMKGFAGFEDMPLPAGISITKLCGMTWTTDTGNATPPPPTVPGDMLVIVSSQITQNGSVVSGNIVEVIVVHNDPGYQPSPGHDGTGTEEAIVCKTP